MIQSLHILRKDIRHLWPDLSLYAALLIAASAIIPMAWNFADTSSTPLHLFAGLLNILIPIIWLVIIARLIHDEALVGDIQFWITRPYKWTSLLSAKLLFILLCLMVPFALTQWARFDAVGNSSSGRLESGSHNCWPVAEFAFRCADRMAPLYRSRRRHVDSPTHVYVDACRADLLGSRFNHARQLNWPAYAASVRHRDPSDRHWRPSHRHSALSICQPEFLALAHRTHHYHRFVRWPFWVSC